MSMNYVGNVSILDRGDAPAQAVIDRNARSLAQRVADETKDQLHKVLKRVENIYGNFELGSTIAETGRSANMEYVNDVMELEELLTDQIKKKKYQQQVTIFIVGYENVCGQKLRLIQQVNDFFMENMQQQEEEELLAAPQEELDMDAVAESVEESLNHAHNLANRLNDLNAEIKEYLIQYANAKSSSKNIWELSRGKKKLEKALQQAKDDIGMLSDKLLAAQQEIAEKEDKMQQLFKQIEMKNMEAQRYRTVAEVAKKNSSEADMYREEIAKRDEVIKEMKQHIEGLQLDVGQVQHARQQSQQRLASQNKDTSQQLEELQKTLEEQHLEYEEEKRRLTKMHVSELESEREEHKQEIDKLIKEHADEIKKILEDNEKKLQARASLRVSDDTDGRSRTSSKDSSGYSRQRGGKSRSRSRESKGTVKKTGSKQNTRSFVKSKSGSRSSVGSEHADIGVQDEGGDPSTARVEEGGRSVGKSRSSLAPVQEMHFEDSFPLQDEESWAGVPPEHVPGRFLQYRQLSRKALANLEEQLDVTVTKTQRKVQTLKSQFQEHKDKWQKERHMLVEQVEQAYKLQGQAEVEADAAMTQLEEFITEQEELEKEEEDKRQELDMMEKQVSGLSAKEAEAKLQQATLQHQQEMEQQLAVQRQLEEELEQRKQEQREREEREEEERRQQELLQQTDDAKAQELQSRPGTKSEVASKHSSSAKSKQSKVSAKSKESKASSAAMTEQAPVSSSPSKPEQGNGCEADCIDTASSSPESGIPILKVSQSRASLADNHESLRLCSAQSRASLRSQHKNRLEARRSAMEERLAHSPALSLRSQKSILTDLELDEEADLPFPDDVKSEAASRKSGQHFDVGTSPPPREHTKTSLFSSKSPDVPNIQEESTEVADNQEEMDQVDRDPEPDHRSSVVSEQEERVDITEWKSIPMAEHPIVQEYLKAYDTVISFKDALGKLMLDRDMMSAGQMLVDMEQVVFDTEERVIPQVEAMTKSIRSMLEETAGLLGSLLMNSEGEYPVSSLMGLSRDNTRTNVLMRGKSVESAHTAEEKAESFKSYGTTGTKARQAQELTELREQYAALLKKFEEENAKHQEQLNHNTVVMMEMQDTIAALQRELQELRSQSAQSRQSDSQSPIMFTRLDSERNAKVMKRAMNENRLPHTAYQDAVEQMESYISLPAKRFAHLVHKYVHHCQMKEIEEKVRKSKSLNDNVFMILDKMESLQNVRARRWADRMDSIGEQRMKLAQMLMDTLNSIEQESGIFLIKPMYSLRGRDDPLHFASKMSRPLKSRGPAAEKHPGYYGYPPSPVRVPSGSSAGRDMRLTQSYNDAQALKATQQSPLEGDTVGLIGKPEALLGDYPRPVWNPSFSTSKNLAQDHKLLLNPHLNTPRILELDINRMMIGQNQVSTKVTAFGDSDDRLVNAANSSVRSYVTINRPVGHSSPGADHRPRSHTGISDHSVPPSTPLRSIPGSATEQRTAIMELPATSPLPPIARSQASPSKEERPIPPHSPPGSSLCQTPDVSTIHPRSATNTQPSPLSVQS